jgi:putative phosphoesterase
MRARKIVAAPVSRRARASRIGVISDTHGLLRPEAVDALRGSDLILHGGDVGKPEVLESLSAIASVVAVRGNNDAGPWADALPQSEVVEVGSVALYLLHDIAELDVDPAAAGIAAVISGHSHRPSAEVREGVLFLNPGSAGPRRFTLPVSLARLEVRGKTLRPTLIEIEIRR